MTILSDYQLIWSDEFDGSSLNTNKWEIFQSSDNYWSANNVSVANSKLRLTATKDGIGTNIHSGYVRSKYKFKYGYLEVSAKEAKGRGFMNQIWTKLYPSGTCGPFPEIDLQEGPGEGVRIRELQINTHKKNSPDCVHYQMPQKRFTDVGFDLSTAFHKYAMEWTSTFIKFYLDDVLKYTFNNDDWINQLQTIILSLCVAPPGGGCALTNGYDNTTPFPSTMEIDYVRVYQLGACPTPAIMMTIP